MQTALKKGVTLISGANGFIGRHLFFSLTEQGIRCKVLVRKYDTFIHSRLPQSDIYEGSLHDSIRNPSVYNDVDTIVHCAARVHNMNETSPSILDTYRQINKDLTLDFARLSLDFGVRTFIFLSTVKVMGDLERTEKVMTEEDKAKPSDPYGISKYEAETGLRALFSKQEKSRCIIIRLPMVYGPGNKGNMLLLQKAASNKIPLPLKGVRGKRSMVYVGNVCDAIEKISNAYVGNASPVSTYFITDGIDYTSDELYNAIFMAMHGRNGTFHFPLPLFRIPSYCSGKARRILSRLLDNYQFSSEKLKKEYNWYPRFSLKQGIDETVAWYKNKVGGIETQF